MSALFLICNGVLLTIALILLIPISVLLIECIAALLPARQDIKRSSDKVKLAILVPAHNEASGIRPVLETLMTQLQASELRSNEPHRLVVIADNCTDNTAAIARSTGATVVERQDADRRGKGFALDYGMQFLANNPPDVVIIVDADCEVASGTIDRISRQALATHRPVQAVYLMARPTQPKPKDAVSSFAFLVKNLVRPRGMERLGMPSPLTGTGMAFPWTVIRSAKLASGNIVEDMQLGVDLAIAGQPPALCVDALVMGRLPQQEGAAKSQRTRWEHGHIQTLLTQVPRLLKAAFQKQRFDLLAMALDLAIPPLTLLVMLWLVGLSVAIAFFAMGGSALPVTLLSIGGGMLLGAIGLTWARFGRSTLPLITLLAVPFYMLWKVPLYFAFLVRPQKKWVRTERDVV